MILSGHQRRAGVDGVLALVSLQGQLVSAGRDGRIIVWKDGNQAPPDGGRGWKSVKPTSIKTEVGYHKKVG